MIRNLTIVAVASFVLCLGCFAGAFALGGPKLLEHGWNFPADWNINVSDDGEHVDVRRIENGTLTTVSKGEHRTRDIPWTGAHELQIDLPAQVIFTQGSEPRITVSGSQGAVDRVAVMGGRIFLAGSGEGHSVRVDRDGVRVLDNLDNLTIEIVAPDVRSFTVNGSGDLHLKGYDQADLALEINGSGNVDAEGKAKKVDLRVAGSGEADLRSLDTGDAKIALAGSGEAHVAPHGAAEVDVAGSGDVYLTSKPTVLSSNVAGSGEVHQDW
ncbi:MAG: DUF2807 domain-containing protein [Caulobacter sp.]|nr:DUF2807 domain-containing protein [Caulobacter sp.]